MAGRSRPMEHQDRSPTGLSQTQVRRQNERYREGHTPSELHQEAFRRVLRGEKIDEDTRTELVNRLYRPWPDRMKETPVDPFEPVTPTDDVGNGLAKAVVRKEYSIRLHISEKLWRQQPIGVLLGQLNDAVRKRGEALITDTTPRSAEVESGVMPAEHMKLTIEPLPLWFEKWVGASGYAPIE